MKKKSSEKKEEGLMSQLGGVFGFFKDNLMFFAKDIIKEKFEAAMEYVEARLIKMQRKLLSALAVGLLGFAAVICAVLAGMFYLFDTLKISRAGVFLAVALTFAVLAVIISYANRR